MYNRNAPREQEGDEHPYQKWGMGDVRNERPRIFITKVLKGRTSDKNMVGGMEQF
jgi:hypothetical protein